MGTHGYLLWFQVMEDIQVAMNTKDVAALGRALKEAERLNVDEVGGWVGRCEHSHCLVVASCPAYILGNIDEWNPFDCS